ncbi:hypothetical protein SCA6_005392 [Theobroma cacao]
MPGALFGSSSSHSGSLIQLNSGIARSDVRVYVMSGSHHRSKPKSPSQHDPYQEYVMVSSTYLTLQSCFTETKRSDSNLQTNLSL